MTTYLIKGASILGGEPTDLLLRDGDRRARSATGRTPREGAEVDRRRPG